MAIKINNITPEMSVWGMRLRGVKNTSSGPEYAYTYQMVQLLLTITPTLN